MKLRECILYDFRLFSLQSMTDPKTKVRNLSNEVYKVFISEPNDSLYNIEDQFSKSENENETDSGDVTHSLDVYREIMCEWGLSEPGNIRTTLAQRTRYLRSWGEIYSRIK